MAFLSNNRQKRSKTMKVISARQHGYLDYLTVGVFLLAPTVLTQLSIPLTTYLYNSAR
jgi:hypothetical protein